MIININGVFKDYYEIKNPPQKDENNVTEKEAPAEETHSEMGDKQENEATNDEQPVKEETNGEQFVKETNGESTIEQKNNALKMVKRVLTYVSNIVPSLNAIDFGTFKDGVFEKINYFLDKINGCCSDTTENNEIKIKSITYKDILNPKENIFFGDISVSKEKLDLWKEMKRIEFVLRNMTLSEKDIEDIKQNPHEINEIKQIITKINDGFKIDYSMDNKKTGKQSEMRQQTEMRQQSEMGKQSEMGQQTEQNKS